MKIEDHIAAILKESRDKKQEADHLMAMLDAYPDLQIRYPGRSRSPHYASKAVNSQVDQVLVTTTCSCCPDPGVVAYFWKKTEFGNVYSDPCRFDVGDHWDYDQPRAGWKDKLREAGIPEPAIQKVADHFKNEAHERLEEAQADLDRVLEGIDDG